MAMAQKSEAETEPPQPSEQEQGEKREAPTDEDNPAAQEEFAPKEFDAEEYFKRGEDNIYKGSNCAPPPDLIT